PDTATIRPAALRTSSDSESLSPQDVNAGPISASSMSMSERPFRVPVGGAILLALIGPALTSCGESDSLSDDVRSAAGRIVAVSGGGGSLPSEEARERTYSSVVSGLQPKLQRGMTAEGPARLLLSRALMGQGEIEADRARSGEFQVIHKLSRVRSKLDLFIRTKGVGDALAEVGPTGAEAELSVADETLDTMIAREREMLAMAETDLGALREEISQQRAQAEGPLAEARRLQADADDMPASQRVRAFEERYRLLRTAAEYQRREQELSDAADLQEAVIADIRDQVASLVRRKELLAAARDRVVRLERLRTEEANAARDAARRMSAEVVQAFEGALATYDESVRPHYDNAVRSLENAARQAQQARSDSPEGSGPMQGAAQHALASLQRGRAEMLGRMVEVGERIGAVASEASEIRARTSSLREEADQARSAAAEAYAAASGAYSGARVDGDAREVFQRLAGQFEAQAALLRGEEPPQQSDDQIGDDDASMADDPMEMDDASISMEEADIEPAATEPEGTDG
ncbi:MAG: hypothetical protein AAFX05_06695, partial [Planctomycetota bacterium]